MKTLNITIKILAFILAMVFIACSDDDNDVGSVGYKIPTASIEKATYEGNEGDRNPIMIKVVLDKPAPAETYVHFTVEGTAEEDVHYIKMFDTKLRFRKDDQEEIIFINPKNNPLIEDDKTLKVTLVGDDFVKIDEEKGSADVTIRDNKNAGNNAPDVIFTTASTEMLTNAYCQDTIVVSIGINNPVYEDVMIPLSFGGDAVEETNFTVEGLSDNNELLLKGGDVTAKFNVIIKNTNQLNIDKTIEIGFVDPVVTDYVIGEANNMVSINIIDPEVNNIWFLDKTSTADRTGNELINIATDENGHRAYDENNKSLPAVVYQGVYTPYTQRKKSDGTWTTASPYAMVYTDPTDPNMWVADYKFTYYQIKDFDATSYPYYDTKASNNYDLKDLFPRYYLIGYDDPVCDVEKYLRLAATNKDATSGRVIIPEQDITCYRAKAGVDWRAKEAVEGYDSEQYHYRVDGNLTQGDITKSSEAEAFVVTVSGEGTFDVATKIITFKVKFTTDDPNLIEDEVEYRIVPLSSDRP